MKIRFLMKVAATVATTPLLAHAQHAASAAALPQQAVHAHIHPSAYESAFADYSPYQDPKPGTWRALNDAVGTAALKPPAHAGHDMPVAPAPSAASAPANPVHHHHHQGMQPAPAHGGH